LKFPLVGRRRSKYGLERLENHAKLKYQPRKISEATKTLTEVTKGTKNAEDSIRLDLILLRSPTKEIVSTKKSLAV
jgi:hypothetical protein